MKREFAALKAWQFTCRMMACALFVLLIMLCGAWAEGALPFLIAALAALGALCLAGWMVEEARRVDVYMEYRKEAHRRAITAMAENESRAYRNRQQMIEYLHREAMRNE